MATPFAHLARHGAPLLFYRGLCDDWSLWWPCVTCGGAQLALINRPDVGELARDLDRTAQETQRQACPGCHTRRQRGEPCGRDPVVWYDTILRDWVVRFPSTDRHDRVILPLEIRWFDAPQALVHRAAADLVYSGDVLHDEAAGEEPS